MPSLMTIAHELRATIIDHVLFTPYAPLTYPNHESHQPAPHDHEPRGWPYGLSHTYYPTDPIHYKPNASSLLLTNKQLHCEIRDRLSRRPLTYHIHNTIVNEADLYATWTCIPAIAGHIDNIKATFTIAGSQIAERGAQPSSVSVPGDVSKQEITWCFYSLLERFFSRGASPIASNNFSIPTANTQKKTYTIGHLEIDVQDTPLLPHQRIHPCGRNGCRGDPSLCLFVPDPGLEYVMDPEYLTSFLAEEIDELTDMYDSYGDILFEHVGRISLSHGGEVERTWDLDDILGMDDQPSLSANDQNAAKMELRKVRERQLPATRSALGNRLGKD
jgi:hypothetical protein